MFLSLYTVGPPVVDRISNTTCEGMMLTLFTVHVPAPGGKAPPPEIASAPPLYGNGVFEVLSMKYSRGFFRIVASTSPWMVFRCPGETTNSAAMNSGMWLDHAFGLPAPLTRSPSPTNTSGTSGVAVSALRVHAARTCPP